MWNSGNMLTDVSKQFGNLSNGMSSSGMSSSGMSGSGNGMSGSGNGMSGSGNGMSGSGNGMSGSVSNGMSGSNGNYASQPNQFNMTPNNQANSNWSQNVGTAIKTVGGLFPQVSSYESAYSDEETNFMRDVEDLERKRTSMKKQAESNGKSSGKSSRNIDTDQEFMEKEERKERSKTLVGGQEMMITPAAIKRKTTVRSVPTLPDEERDVTITRRGVITSRDSGYQEERKSPVHISLSRRGERVPPPPVIVEKKRTSVRRNPLTGEEEEKITVVKRTSSPKGGNTSWEEEFIERERTLSSPRVSGEKKWVSSPSSPLSSPRRVSAEKKWVSSSPPSLAVFSSPGKNERKWFSSPSSPPTTDGRKEEVIIQRKIVTSPNTGGYRNGGSLIAKKGGTTPVYNLDELQKKRKELWKNDQWFGKMETKTTIVKPEIYSRTYSRDSTYPSEIKTSRVTWNSPTY